MSTLATPALRTVTFGDPDEGLWGALWGAGEPTLAVAEVGSAAAPGGAPVRIGGAGPDEEWRLTGIGVDLTLAAQGDPWSAEDGAFEQLCQVRGEVRLAGGPRRLDCLGRRGARDAAPEDYSSLRDVSAWFAPDEGLTLTALRPRRAAGHDKDVISAAIFEPAGVITVEEPRLSTTYAADGVPARVGLELWLQADEDGEQYPRRAAGEALGAPARFTHAGHDVQANVLRWHSRGHEGAGVYLLVRPR